MAFGGLTLETILAMHGIGCKGLRPIHGQPQVSGKAPNIGQPAVLFKTLKDFKRHPIEGTRHYRIEQVAYLVVTGNRLNATHRRGIVLSLGLLKMALVRQKRRRLGEKDTTGAQGGILDAVTGVGPCFAMVRQCSDPSVQDTFERIEA